MLRIRTALLVSLLVCSFSGQVSAQTSNEDCDRECLYSYVDLYLSAMVAHDPSSLPLSADVKFTENDTVLQLGEGVWQTIKTVGSYQIYTADVQEGQAGFMGVLHLDDISSLLSLRLKIDNGLITEIETIVPGYTIADSNLSGFMAAPATLVTARPGYKTNLHPNERASRETLLQAADSYYTGVEEGSGDVVAFSDECHRMENGLPLVNNPDYEWPMVAPEGKELPNFAAMGCREQFNTKIWATDSISDRRYPLIDEEKGIVFGFTIYHQFSKKQCAEVPGTGSVCPAQPVTPFSLALVEAFKIRNGEIYEMESVWAILSDNRQDSQW